MKKLIITILKILGYILAVFVVDICLMGISQLLFGEWAEEYIQNGPEILHEGLFLLLSLIIVNTLVAILINSDLVKLGWPALKTGFKWFFNGGLIGMLTAAGMLILSIFSGGGEIVVENFDLTVYVSTILPLLGILVISALSEEWLFRGFPLTVLAEATGRGWANLAFAVLFAVAHLGSSGMSWIVFINIVIGGLILGALRFSKGGIPAAWGFHFAWNSTQILFGSTLTGEQLYVPGISFNSVGRVLFSGGEMGPEGGLGATVATLILLVLFGIYFRKNMVFDLPVPQFKSVF